MSERLRIALVSSDYTADAYEGRGGGIETYVRVMSRGLADAGHDVHVVASAARATRTRVEGGVHVHALHVPDQWGAQCAELPEARAALSFAWHAWRKVASLSEGDGVFDVVESPEYKAQGYYISADDRLPSVLKCHAHLRLCLALNGTPLTPDTALIVDLEREALTRARAVHANSRALAARCAADYGLDPGRFACVPYGIDVETFSPGETPPSPDQRTILFVGRLEARKGIDVLVPAFAQVARRHGDVTLVLVGPDVAAPEPFGSEGARMRARWDELGVPPDRYRFVGTMTNDALVAWYRRAALLVAPSAFEAFGLVYTEAMACGCPPIGCTGGGAAEVVQDGDTGLLVAPGDVDALADAMERLLEDTSLRTALSRRGRAHAVSAFSIPAMVDRTVRFYREALR